MSLFKRKSQNVDAMYWDGSKENYLEVKEWLISSNFLVDGRVHSDYWDTYPTPPSERTSEQMNNLRLTPQEFDWRYRTIRIYDTYDEHVVDVDRWIVVESLGDVPIVNIMRSEDFWDTYEW